MNVEVMIYIYLAVCVAMIVFNIVNAFVLKRKDKRTVRVSENFRHKVEEQLELVKNGESCDAKHKHYIARKLKRVGNMMAFDKMLESAYLNNADTVKKYLCELDSVFIFLCMHYSGKDRIEAAYFPYIVKKYRLIEFRPLPTVIESMLSLLDEPSIYCRENAMQALYSCGESEIVVKALQKVDKAELFYHGKIISDGLLNFAGDKNELIDQMIEKFDSFSVNMKVNLLNYIRFATSGYCEFMYSLLCDDKQDDEIRYSCIRYLGKYYYEKAYDKIYSLAENLKEERWQYSAIASTALAIYSGEKTVALLKRNLYSFNWYIRFNSAESLKRLGVKYTELIDILEGNDRYAAEIVRYRIQYKKEDGSTV